MQNFVVHIFGYGETQLITNESNVKYKTEKLTKVQPLVDAVWNLKPEKVTGEKKYHIVNFFGKNDVRWVSENQFILKDEETLIPLIDELITEIKEYKAN